MVTENDVVGQILMPVSITRMDMENILNPAFKYRISNWCRSFEYEAGLRADRHALGHYAPNGFSIVLFGEEKAFETRLTETTLLAGIQKWATWMEEHGNNVDFDNIDADAADQIVQFALFGEITFG